MSDGAKRPSVGLLCLSVACVSVACVVAACGNAATDADRSFAVADRAGVDIISIHGHPPDTVVFEAPAVRIGSTGVGAREHYAFELISDIAVYPNGRIVVVDNRGARVAVFDSSGSWLYDIGREGEGPGEYLAPIYETLRGDTLYLRDSRLPRVSRFAGDGTFIGAERWVSHLRARPFEAAPGGYIQESESGQLMDPAPARGSLVRLSPAGAIQDTLVGPYPIPEYGWEITDAETGMGHMVNPPALAVGPAWAAGNGILMWVRPTSAVIEVRNLATNELERVIMLPRTIGPPSGRDRERFFASARQRFNLSEQQMAGVREQTKFADRIPPIADLLLDGQGRIWAAEHDPTARDRDYVGSAWDRINVQRQDFTHVRFPANFRLMVVRGRRAYGITTTELGVHVVDVFDLES